MLKVRSENILRITETKKVRRAALAILIAVGLLNVGILADGRISTPEGPNIILLTIETLRADHLSCYGYEKETTPTIDAVAKEGVLFSNMFAPRGLTWPSLSSLMTSLYPVNHGIRDNGQLLYPSAISLAEILKNNGYTCGAFLAYANNGPWTGFDLVIDAEFKDEEITSKAIEWLRNNRRKKMFLWVHYYQPHWPYQPPEPYASFFDPGYKGLIDGSLEQQWAICRNKIELDEADLNHMVSLYDGSILLVDDQIKRLLESIEKFGLKEESLIIIMGDHGDDLYQHNYYFNHIASIYGSVLHIPFIVKFPRSDPKGAVIEEIVEIIDVAPTILEIAGIPLLPHFEGATLTPLLSSKDVSNSFRRAYSELEDKILSIRTDRYRYIFNPEEFHPMKIPGGTKDTYPIEREELYDIVKDPAESRNIVSTNREIADELLKELLDWDNFKSWARGSRGRIREAPEHIKEQLRALGYI